MKPTFLVIGAQKAATTSLYHYLGAHPDVFVSPGKELNYFVLEQGWSNGQQWYEAQFVGGSSILAAFYLPLVALAESVPPFGDWIEWYVHLWIA